MRSILTIWWKDNHIAGREISQENSPRNEGCSFRKKMMEAALTVYVEKGRRLPSDELIGMIRNL
jgi:hypothetical protein